MSYQIKQYTKKQAKKLGVSVKPSTNPKKKIDVFDKDGNKIASVGAIGYNDYPTYLETDKKIAEKKRRAYKARHEKDRNIKNTNGFYADKLLW